jgi:hypothetical protein
MKIIKTLKQQQRDLFEIHRRPLDWKVLPSSVQEELLTLLTELLQSPPARRRIQTRKEDSHE